MEAFECVASDSFCLVLIFLCAGFVWQQQQHGLKEIIKGTCNSLSCQEFDTRIDTPLTSLRWIETVILA